MYFSLWHWSLSLAWFYNSFTDFPFDIITVRLPNDGWTRRFQHHITNRTKWIENTIPSKWRFSVTLLSGWTQMHITYTSSNAAMVFVKGDKWWSMGKICQSHTVRVVHTYYKRLQLCCCSSSECAFAFGTSHKSVALYFPMNFIGMLVFFSGNHISQKFSHGFW